MTHHHKVDENTSRIIDWLKAHSAKFEQGEIEENHLADSVGLTKAEVMQSIDRLENREAVVRFPHPSSSPPQTMVKPGRGWQDLVEKAPGQAAKQ